MRLTESRKQYNRLGALKYSVINDIGMIAENNEIELLEDVVIKNPADDSVGTIKKISKETAVIEIDGKTHQIELSDIDADTVISVLKQLELDQVTTYFNYPKCCVEFFKRGGSWTVHDVNWGGFIPCLDHKDLSLEEITELLGRNPVTANNEAIYTSLRESESETVYEEKYKDLILDIEDNKDGTFYWICHSDYETLEKLSDEFHKSSSLDSQFFFSAQKALENAKEFVDSLAKQ